MQASMMFKLVTARAINSAFLLFIITRDEDQLKDQTLTKVWGGTALPGIFIFFVEAMRLSLYCTNLSRAQVVDHQPFCLHADRSLTISRGV